MVHATRIRKGKAAYANHWVQTSNFKQELSAGRALFLKARRSRPCSRALQRWGPAWTHLRRRLHAQHWWMSGDRR